MHSNFFFACKRNNWTQTNCLCERKALHVPLVKPVLAARLIFPWTATSFSFSFFFQKFQIMLNCIYSETPFARSTPVDHHLIQSTAVRGCIAKKAQKLDSHSSPVLRAEWKVTGLVPGGWRRFVSHSKGFFCDGDLWSPGQDDTDLLPLGNHWVMSHKLISIHFVDITAHKTQHVGTFRHDLCVWYIGSCSIFTHCPQQNVFGPGFAEESALTC